MESFHPMQPDLSILIPARNEVFLAKTVENLLENIEGNTEIIVVMDGGWIEPPIKDDPRVTIIEHNKAVGQRQATNDACKLSSAKWVMKIDAHCAVDKGFDVKMMQALEGHDDWTMLPAMYNLHAFNWKCKKCGNEWYQGPTPTHCMNNGENKGVNELCDSTEFERVILWKPRMSRRSECYRFDTTLHFQYDHSRSKKIEGDIVETMSAQGSCFMLTREKYWELDISEEEFGSWGQQGTEIACKTWLSGGRLVTNRKTWYAHMFRTQGGDFGFPYKQENSQVEHARKYSRDLFIGNKWKGQKKPLSWLLDKFKPADWYDQNSKELLEKVKNTPLKSNKGIIFYTDNRLNLKVAHMVQKRLRSIGLPIVSCSLKPMKLGTNIHLKLERSYLTMFKQILAALEASTADIVFFCEHDVLYDPSHFDFTPPEKDVWYYNTNVWKVRFSDGHGVKTDNCKQVSGICVYRETAIEHYKKRIKLVEEYRGDNFNKYLRRMGFEPGTHTRKERVDRAKSVSWESKNPNLDIRHENNLTSSRWSKEQFRNAKYTNGWTEQQFDLR